MAVNIIKRTWHQNQMVKIEPLNGFAFQAENGGHTFEISGIDDSGNAVPISGTIAGVFLRPDNTDVALTGSASGGVASVTLKAECYAVPGRFLLTVYATSGSNKGTIYAAMGTVSRTSSGAVSPAASSDVVDLVNRINAATATIPASYTTLLNAVAGDYSDTKTYAVKDFVWYNGHLYRCTTAITTAETWTAAHWNQVVLSDALNQDITDLKSAITEDTYNLYQFLIENRSVTADGKFDTDSKGYYSMAFATVEAGKTYTAMTNDSVLVYVFFTTIPKLLDNSFDGRHIETVVRTFTAPINGYVAWRIIGSEYTPQLVAGTEEKPYVPPITAVDSIARINVDTANDDISAIQDDISAINNDTTAMHDDIEEINSNIERIKDNTYNIVEGIIPNANFTSTGMIEHNAASADYCIAYAQVEQGKTYNCINNDTLFVYAFFSEKPSYGATAYEGRHVESSNAFIAPINGYVALRIIGEDAQVQITEGNGDKIYVPSITACDYIARNFNTLYKKYLVATGDSLTAGAGIPTPGGDNDRQTKPTYAYLTAQRNGMQYYNDALSGSTMSDITANGDPKRGFSKTRYLNIPSNADFLTIFFGWNDHAYGPLSYKDTWCQTNYNKLYKDCTAEEKAVCDSAQNWDNIWLGEADSVNVKTWTGAWNTVLDYYMRNRPNTKVGIILPYFSTPYDALALSMRERLITISKSFGVPYIDAADCSVWASTGYSIGISAASSAYLKSQRTYDGLHDNAYGYKLKVPEYEEWLKRL